jgi:hypothetical protein
VTTAGEQFSMNDGATIQHASFLTRTIRGLIPWRLRRALFLTSVYQQMLAAEDKDPQHIRQLNKVLNLSKGGLIGAIPIMTRVVYWSRRTDSSFEINDRRLTVRDVIREDVDEDSRQQLLEQIARSMPAVIRYARLSLTVYDLKRLFKQAHTLGLCQAN